jgi:SAM-dependent methyltransferase
MGDRGSDGDWVIDGLRRHCPDASSLLELGCGTGLILDQLSWVPSLTGLDHSPAMLAVARERLPAATLLEAEIASFSLGRRFDAVLCVFDTLNHLTSFEEWRRTFGTVHAHLHEGGLFMFDVNTAGKLRRLSEAPPWVQEFDGHLMVMDVMPGEGEVTKWDIKVFEHIDAAHYELRHERIGQLAVPLQTIRDELAPLFSLIDDFDENSHVPTDDSSRACFVYRRTP